MFWDPIEKKWKPTAENRNGVPFAGPAGQEIIRQSPYELYQAGSQFVDRAVPSPQEIADYLKYDFWGAPQPEEQTPTPVPSTTPQIDPIMAMLSQLGQGGTTQTRTIDSGVSLPPPSRMGGILDELAALKPPQEELPTEPEYTNKDRLAAVLQGLAASAGNIRQGAPTSDILLQAGLGALGGYGQQKSKEGESGRKHKSDVTASKNRQANANFQNRLALIDAMFKGAGGESESAYRNATLMKPQVSGDTVLVPQNRGGKIQYEVQSTPGSKTALRAQLAMAAAAADVPTMFNSVLMNAPGVLDRAAKGIGVSTQMLRGAGLSEKSVDLATQARIIQWLRENEPENFAAIQQLAQREALKKALFKR